MLVVALAVTVLIVAIARFKRSIALPFTFAFVISLLWTSFYRYEYVGANLFLFDRINLYPLTLWTVGLTLLYIAHTSVLKRYSLLVTTGIYVMTLGVLEAIAYHLLGIRLISSFPDFLDLGILHAPLYVQIFYIVTGPVYIIIIEYVLKRLIKPSKQLR